MINNRFILLIIFVVIQVASCSHEIDTESYYLKKDYLEKETLKFISKENNETQIWQISRNKLDNIIITKRLNSKDEIIDKLEEKITNKGSKLISYEFLLKNKVLHSRIKFFPKLNDLLLWDLNKASVYTGEYIFDGIIFKFKRERVFIKEENQVLVFKDSYEFKPISEKFKNGIFEFNEMNFTQTSYYKKNIGLVKYERIDSRGNKVKFELSEEN